jgi:hypothetical protein
LCFARRAGANRGRCRPQVRCRLLRSAPWTVRLPNGHYRPPYVIEVLVVPRQNARTTHGGIDNCEEPGVGRDAVGLPIRNLADDLAAQPRRRTIPLARRSPEQPDELRSDALVAHLPDGLSCIRGYRAAERHRGGGACSRRSSVTGRRRSAHRSPGRHCLGPAVMPTSDRSSVVVVQVRVILSGSENGGGAVRPKSCPSAPAWPQAGRPQRAGRRKTLSALDTAHSAWRARQQRSPSGVGARLGRWLQVRQVGAVRHGVDAEVGVVHGRCAIA